jgi:hypothetical protein
MRKTMRSRVRDYLAQRRALGFWLRSEGYLLLSFARYAGHHANKGRLTHKLKGFTRQRRPDRGAIRRLLVWVAKAPYDQIVCRRTSISF